MCMHRSTIPTIRILLPTIGILLSTIGVLLPTKGILNSPSMREQETGWWEGGSGVGGAGGWEGEGWGGYLPYMERAMEVCTLPMELVI